MLDQPGVQSDDSARCLDDLSDPWWRINHLYKVRDENGVVLPFKPNKNQRRLFKKFHSRNIVLKARQLGMTTFFCVLFLDAVLFSKGVSALVVAHRKDDARKIFANKVKWVYQEFCKDWPDLAVAAVGDSASELKLENSSSIAVDVSGRSGTYQYLLITEFGKTCAQFPQRADEVISGTLNAAHTNAIIAIESTAEGQDGHFYSMCRRSQAATPDANWPDSDLDFDFVDPAPLESETKRALSPLDYRFHFFPWYEDSRYVLNPRLVVVPDHLTKYFNDLETLLGIELSDEQRAWYAKTEETQGGLMTREYPSHPAEAFSAALEGCYLEQQIMASMRRDRIGSFTLRPGVPVNTFWDIGISDNTSIWFHQRIGEKNLFINYYENAGETIMHYAQYLADYQRDNGIVYGTHHAPHDVARGDFFLPHGRIQAAKEARINFEVVPRVARKLDGIEASRNIFPSCWFDQRACGLGLKRLRHYRKEWSDKLQCFKDTPLHDINSHGYDAFETFAVGYRAPAKKSRSRERKRGRGLV